MTWFEIEIANRMAKERTDRAERNALFEARLSGYPVPSPYRFNVVTTLRKLFQGRKKSRTIVPETNTRRRPA